MVDLAEIERLIALMKSSGVMELAVQSGDLKVSLRRAAQEPSGNHHPSAAEAAQSSTTQGTGEPISPKPTKSFATPVISPLVGVFHNGGMSDHRMLLKEGDRVREGQVIAAIEAMKVLNELRSPVSGIIGQVLAEDGGGVEYGQTLFLIQPEETAEEAPDEAG